jgi:hypothetical protein
MNYTKNDVKTQYIIAVLSPSTRCEKRHFAAKKCIMGGKLEQNLIINWNFYGTFRKKYSKTACFLGTFLGVFW